MLLYATANVIAFNSSKSLRKVLFAIALFATGVTCRADTFQLSTRSKMVVGSELRLVIETSRSYRPFLSHNSETADAKGYFVTIDISSDRPLPERTRFYGPIWKVPNPRSSISFDAGAMYSKDDVNAARASPMCIFSEAGDLLRFTIDEERRVLVRDVLLLFSAPRMNQAYR